jgi:hypothetical protein
MDNNTLPLPNSNNEFEKYKYKVEIVKWIISSVVLVTITTIIDWGFRDRAAGLQEIQQYDKYTTELLILNDNPKNKRMLAQYFSNVIPSEKLRDGWKSYYKEVNEEYKDLIKQDSITKSEIEKLKADSLRLTEQEKLKINQLQKTLDNNQRVLNQPIILPKVSITPTVYIQFIREGQRENAKEIEGKINAMGFNAPGVELVENIKLINNELRYFRESDLDAANALQNFLKDQGIDVLVKYIPSLSGRAKEGTLELWLK